MVVVRKMTMVVAIVRRRRMVVVRHMTKVVMMLRLRMRMMTAQHEGKRKSEGAWSDDDKGHNCAYGRIGSSKAEHDPER